MTRKSLADTPTEADALPDLAVLARLADALEALADGPAGRNSFGIDPELICLTPKQAAGILGMTENWVVERVTDRRIPCTFIGRFPRFQAKHIRAITEAGEIDPAKQGRAAAA
ncbi:hypothetical protein [Actinacidiphila sp. ITFR-21]|uniref:hypothetical protein n=1 Tax=Actinacidiphila sp. ITFR-21 TaxID=3075199 RepID=UPI00288BE988|nr:hypothetical protein [Streptomyces sp. ITFR-21]WNI19118.1 hypothetical protein RLT57_28680 [Streptomyces sp. ITFR-21]